MIELVEHRDAFECLFRENYTRLFYHAFSFLNDEEGGEGRGERRVRTSMDEF